ncbi:acyl-CoA carboxylase subunit beta, partial [Butyricicoccus sp. 1XD8-22]
GAGLYAMCGPAFEPDVCIALPTAQIAVMGPEAAVNAVYSNKIEAISDSKERMNFVKEKIEEYKDEIDIYKLASELVIDEIVAPNKLRYTLCERLKYYSSKQISLPSRKHPVYPV